MGHLNIETHISNSTTDDENSQISNNPRFLFKRHVLGDLSNLSPQMGGFTSILEKPSLHISGVPESSGNQKQIPRISSSTETRIGSSNAHKNSEIENTEWTDLDAEDADDPLMVSEYVNDIFVYLRHLEKTFLPDPDYMKRQNEISWKTRSVLVDWLVEIQLKLKLLPETLFLTVNLVDRFLSIRPVSLAKFQLVGITATLIASKFEEILAPEISNFVALSDESYAEEEILEAECYMLNALQFVVSYPSPYVFLRRVSKADNYDIQTRTLAKYFIETSLLDPLFLRYPPSLIATASLYLARRILSRGEWNANLIHYSGYRSESLISACNGLIAYLQHPLLYESIYRKYSGKRFMKASLFVRDYIIKYNQKYGYVPISHS